jgi:Alpha amylase, catalytic domain
VDNRWPQRPILYEIYAWVWLHELSEQYDRTITLGTVPDEQWDAIAALGVDAVWLMGVWERSPAGIHVANLDEALQEEFQRALADYDLADNVGSAYCVHRYVVDEHLGGPSGLRAAREKLAQRDVRLILDFVPNHVARDHPWVYEHPEYFVQGSGEDVERAPAEFFVADGNVIACGRDPYFPPWEDVAQLNAFEPGLRHAALETANAIADQCDGMRCDMAMLLLNRIFEQTWGHLAGAPPPQEYWREIIDGVRAGHPHLLFVAEAYWDLEWEMQQLGFDYCYDKRLYDRLQQASAEEIRLHLTAGLDYQDRLVRFLENHDEPRAAATFQAEKERAAAVTILTLPGAKLLYEGQLEGRRVRPPVFLARRPAEAVDTALQAFYGRLLQAVGAADLQQGEWRLCERVGWPDNRSSLNLLGWCWRHHEARHLVVVNLSEQRSQAQVRLPWDELAGSRWWLADPLNGDLYERDGDEMRDPGLYVDLPAWGFHFLELSR